MPTCVCRRNERAKVELRQQPPTREHFRRGNAAFTQIVALQGGCARTAASRRTSCRSTSASSSSCTTLIDAAKPCSAPSSPAWLPDVPATTPEANKSL